jgi:aminopeptidase N
MPSLTRAEAEIRAKALRVESYAIDLDLTTGAETFHSRVAIRFSARSSETFAEIKPARLGAVTLNGAAVDPAALVANRLTLTGLRERNELVVEADMAYSNTGEGLHRFVDPADGRVYTYAMTFLDEAQRVFACFDQPDLKAPVTLTVTVDPEWTVLANAAGREERPGHWVFAETPPLATYFVTLAAGPYHSIYAEHDDIPLGLHCRASLASYLDRDAAELFAITRQSFDRLHELFQYRYPFGKYDQVFVPEFNAGAMENPGCVTLRDDLVFRSAVTDAQRERRATTVAHEMAHMWFGDLVTMRWWDDLWLNESFADYLGNRVSGSSGYPNSWIAFAIREKAWGYAADQRPSTHPVAPVDVPDAAEALLNFDGISYAKGAAALRQLASWLGDETFLAGLRAHIRANAYGNATLADLLDALSVASGRDLAAWADAWLRTSEVDTLRPRVTIGADGRYESVVVEQSAPGRLRPHRINIGLFDGGERRLTVPLELPASDHAGSALAGVAAADLLLLNDGDLTYAKVRLDAGSWERLPSLLPAVEDATARAILWGAAWDTVRDAERPAGEFLALAAAALPAESNVIITENVFENVAFAVDHFLPPAQRPAALAVLAGAARRLLDAGEPGGSLQLSAARALIGSTVDAALLRGWLGEAGLPDGLVLDADLRWQVLHRLTVLGAVAEPEIDAELAADRTAGGAEWAARCRAAVGSPEAKARAWDLVTRDLSASNRIVRSTSESFWQPEQVELTESYVDRFFAEMPEVASRRTSWVLERLVVALFPRYAATERTRAAAAALLARDGLDPALRRSVVDADDDLRRTIAARRLA